MGYVDYHFDLDDDIILLDEELKLAGTENTKGWGDLPKSWKPNDMWKLIVNDTGRVCLTRVNESDSRI